ncbi:hemagglutinin repeat-containing protein [Chromobacterium piscinae]|uniref:Hemagglutinin repeat-containing protein n=3 Tax=Chromobacterium piscinae TaxID=686831 RepID=A0ABV0HBM4_9NEIS
MNKHLYRIIFNQSRGQLMVVQEDACGQGKGNGAEGVAATLAAVCKAFSLRLSVLLIGLGLGSSALAADIIADSNAAAGKQPGVIQSANGLPVVQIAAPTAAGVSHNQYQQFNVGPGGALLNNSAVNVNTQLAGYISGNPNLKNGSARIILNEVTQANPSQLRGYLEVAGQRAQVVIANPWGITCSGCGFINTPQVTLTTGASQLNALGALTGYQVAGGRVSIDGAGLNAANIDSFAIISRAVSINANLYAQKLDLVLGRNQVDAATLAAQPLAASPNNAPAFALDVAQLGGMYANAIKLVGTEKGVGVNQLGTMAAQAGDLQLTSAGDLILRGQTHSRQNMILQADGQLRHDGVTRAEGAIQADIAGQTALRQALSAGGDLTLNTGSLQGDGALAAGVQADGKLTDHGRLAVASGGMLQHSGQLLAGGDVSLKAGQADLSQATVSASHGALDIRAAGDVNAQQARLSAAGAARLTLDGQLDNRSGQLAAAQVDLQLGALDNRQGKIVQTGQADSAWRINGPTDNRQGVLASAGRDLKLQSGNLDNRGGEISHAGAGALRLSADALDNREQGRIASDGRLDAQAAQLDNRQGRLVGVLSASVDARQQLNNDGGVLGSDGKLDLAAGALDNGGGLIQSGQDLQLSAASLTNADKGQILALGKDVASKVDVSGELRNQGKLAGNADLTVNAVTVDNSKGTLQAASHLELSKQSSLINDGGHLASQSLTLKADSLSNQAGEIYAQQQLSSQLKTLDNSKGSLIGGQGVDLTVSDQLHNDGVVGSDGQVKLTAGTLENAQGTIQSGKDLQLSASSLTNADKGQILALGKDAASKVDVSGELNNQGKLAGNADLTVSAASIDNSKGTLQAASHLELSKQTSLINDGGHLVGQSLTLNADSLSNKSGELYAQGQLTSQLKTLDNSQGSLIGGQGVDLTATDSLHNDGVVGSDGQVKLSVGTLENAAGTIQSGKDLQLTANSLSNADKGQVLALGKDAASKVDVSGQLRNQGKVAGNADLTVNAATIDNSKGTLQAASHLELSKQTSLTNDGGHIAGQSLKLNADSLSNQAGEIYAQQQLSSQLKTLNNAQGSLIGGQGVDLTVSSLLRNDGVLGSDGQVKLTAGALENAAGTIQSGTDLQLTASSLTNADKGQILALGKDAASTVDVSGELHNQGKLAGNADLTVSAASIDNSKGTLQAASHLELSKQSSLINDGGHLVGQSLTLKADSLSNLAGEIYAQQQLSSTLKTLDNAKGSVIGGQGVDLTVSSLLHNDGVVGSDGQVKLSAGTLENAAGTIQSGKDLQLTASSLSNANKGQILALGKDVASKVDVSGQLRNQGKVAGNADLAVNAATIDNSKGTLQAASHLDLSKQTSLTNDGGHIVGQSLQLKADSLSNQAGEIYAQQQLTSQLKTLNNSQGSLIGGQGVDLTISTLLHNDGVVGSDGQVKLSAGALENAAGTIQSGKDLQLTASSLTNADKGQILALGKDAASTVDVSGELHNQGKLAGNADLTVNAATVDNSQGTLQAASHLELSKQAALTNDGGHIAGQSLKLNADSLSNKGGELYAQGQLTSQLKNLDNSQGSLIGGQGVDLTVSSLLHNDGVVGSDGQVKLSAGKLENAQGTIQSGKELQLTAASLTNSDKGQILALGKDVTSKVDVSGELHNQGKIAGNADLTVNAASVDNSKGTLQAASHLELSKQTSLTNDGGHIAGQSLKLNADSLSNQAGEIYAQQQLTSQLKTLDNSKGSLIGGLGVDLTVSSLLHNDGVVGSDGQVKLTAGTLENAQGTIQSGKDLQLSASSLTNADKGQILALGKDAASKVDVSGELHNQGKVAGNADLTVNAVTIDNAKGTLQAASHLELSKQSTLTNDGGHIAAQNLNLKTDTLSNQSGDIRQIGAGEAKLKIGQAFHNQQGQLLSNGGLTLDAGQLDNRQGTLGSQGAQALTVRQDLNNQGGTLASGQSLSLTLQGALDNQKGIVQGDSLQLDAASLDNRGGGIKALGAGDSRIQLGGKLDNSTAGALAANGNLTLSANQLDNSGSVLQSAATLDVQLKQDAQNGGGTLQAGQLKLSAASLGNQHGQIGQAGAGLATLAIGGQIDNSQQGKITSGGQLQVTAGDLNNNHGVLSSQGDLTLSGKALNNQQGTLGSNGTLTLNAGSLDNSGGLLQAGQTLQLDSGSLRNAGGKVLALGAGDSRLTVTGQLVNGGQIAGNGNWQLKAQGLDNGGGSVYGQRNLAIDTVSLANAGSLLAGQDLSLKLQGDFVNAAGTQLQANRNLSISASGNLVNNGQLQSSGNLSLSGVNWTNNGSVNIGGTLSTQLSQSLVNAGSLGAGALDIDAAGLTNTASITAGDITIQAGNLDNSGGKALLASAGGMALNIGGTLNNHDGAWLYSQGDMRIGQAGAAVGQVVNHIATLQSDGNMFIEAGRVSNESNQVSVQQVASQTVETKPLQKFFDYWCEHPATYGCGGLYQNVWRTVGTTYITRKTVTDIASTSATSAKMLVGGDLDVISSDFLNKYSNVSVGQRLNLGAGLSINNVGQNLYSSTVVETRNHYDDPKNGSDNYAVQNLSPIQVGSLDATVSAGRSLSLQAPTIVNGKDAARVNVSTVAGNAVNNQSAVNQAQGQAINGAGQQAAAAGQTLQGSVSQAQGAQLNGALSSVAGQALGGTAAQGEAGKVLQGALGQAQGAKLSGALSGADGQQLKNGGVDAVAGGALGNTYHSAPAAQQVTLSAGGAKAANPVANGYAVPDNGLFHAKPAPQQPYLVETNPQFTQYSNFISSDYLLKQLNYDPSKVEKRLGDGFYEQQLVTRAVTDMTGKRFLSGYGSAMQQYQQLMSNGAQYAKQFQLTPGMALSADQMAKLTSDMVWLVKQNVGGQDVLVPMVYLANADQKSLRGQGAVLAGNSMSLLASGDLVNTGTLKSDTTLLAQANNIRIEGGKVQAGGDLGLLAAQNLAITDDSQHSQAGSSVKAGGDLQLQAGNDLKLQAAAIDAGGNASLQAGHDLDILSRETRYDLGGGNWYSSYQYQQADHVGSQLNIGGSLAFAAGNDLTLSGSAAKAGGSVLASAGDSLTLSSTLDSKHGAGSWWGGGYDTLSQTRNASLLQGGGDVLLKAGGDLSLSGSSAQSTGGSLAALAGKQLTVRSEVNTHHDIGYNWGNSHNWQADSLAVAGLAGKGDLQLRAGGDALLNGASLASGGKLALSAGNDIKLGAVVTESRNDNTWGQDVHNNYDLTQHGVSVQGEAGLILQAGRDIDTHAANLASNGQEVLMAGRDVNLGTAQNLHSDYTKTVRTEGGFFSSKTITDITSHDSSTAKQTLVSADALVIKGDRDIQAAGAQIVANQDVALLAGRDIKLGSALDLARATHEHIEKTSGLFGGSGAGSFGVTVGSRTKGLEEQQANATHVQGVVGSVQGNVLIHAGGKVDLIGTQLQAGKDIMVDGRDVVGTAVVDTLDSHTLSYTETSGLRIGATSKATQAAANLMNTVSRGEEVSDPRLKALYAAKAAYASRDISSMIQTMQQSTDKGGGLKGKVSIGYGYSREESESKAHVDMVKKALASAGGKIDIQARGDGSGQNGDIDLTGVGLKADSISLNAARDLITRSQEAISSQESTYRKIDLEAGVFLGGSVGKGGGKGGLGVYGAAAMSQSSSELSNVTHEQTTLDAAHGVQVKTGRDASLTGTQVRGESIDLDVGRNLTLTSEQDVDRYRQKSWSGQIEGHYSIYGNDNGAEGSLSYSQTNSDWRGVVDQTGLYAGKGGFDVKVGGHTQLNGAVIASGADPAKNSLATNTLGYSNLENAAEYSSFNGSVNFSMGGDGMGGAPKSPTVMPGMGLPQQDSKSSTTRSAVAQGNIVVKQDQQTGQDSAAGLSRDTASAGGQLERIFDAKKLAEQQEFSRVLGEVGFHVVGDLSEKMGWKDGSPEKMALHGLMGALQAKAGGGNVLAGMTAAAANEWVGTQVADYLQSHTDLDENQRKAVQQWSAVATGTMVGGLSGGNGIAAMSGGAVALDGEKYNRQLHPSQVAAVRKKAKELAGKDSLSEVQWQTRLEKQLAYENDAMYKKYGNDKEAETILKQVSAESGVRMDYRNDAAQFNNQAINLEYVKSLSSVYAQLPRLTPGDSNQHLIWEAALKSDDFKRIGTESQREVVYQLGMQYQDLLRKEARANPSSPDYLTLVSTADDIGRMFILASNKAAETGAISKSELGGNLLQYGYVQTGYVPGHFSSGKGTVSLSAESGSVIKSGVKTGGAGTSTEVHGTMLTVDGEMSGVPVRSGERPSKLNEASSKSIVDAKAELVQNVADLRSFLTGSAKKSGNMGVAQIDIPGVQSLMAASSRLDNPSLAQQGRGFVGLVNEKFPSSSVITADGRDVHRSTDSEAKILNNIATQLGDNFSIVGTINLMTERSPCESCSNVIQQFRQKYPNVTVNIFDNGGKNIMPSKKGS